MIKLQPTWKQTIERNLFLLLIWITLKTRHFLQKDWKIVNEAKDEDLKNATWSLNAMMGGNKDDDERAVRRKVARVVAFQFAYYYFVAVSDSTSPTQELDRAIGEKFLVHGFCPRTGRTVEEFKQMNFFGQLELLAYLQKRTIGFGYILEDTIAGKYADAKVTKRLAKTHTRVGVTDIMYHRIIDVAAAAIAQAAGATKEHLQHLVNVLDCLKTNMDTSFARDGIINL